MMEKKALVGVTLDGGKKVRLPAGSTGATILREGGVADAAVVLAMAVNGEVWDLSRALPDGSDVSFLRWEDDGGKMAFWHSSAHVLAEAILALHPQAQLGIGPAIGEGFYYDVDFGDETIDASGLVAIEKKMRFLLKQKRAFHRREVTKEEAIAHFQQTGNSYKLELLEGIDDVGVTFYQQGDFVDLCKGPHLPSTGPIKAAKVLNMAGAYWRGDVKRKQLTRIYGITFPSKALLATFLKRKEEAVKRDHRKLGRQLGFFATSPMVGSGLYLWLPKGAFLREKIISFMQEKQRKAGYLPVVTPHIGSKELYVTSGHYAKYKNDTFQPIKTPQPNETFFLKPMNCPHHCAIYQVVPKSYRDLPCRLAEFGTVYRYEQSGELHGLTRTRGFTQDDAHIFCRHDQVEDEFVKVIDLVMETLKRFHFNDFEMRISLRGDDKKNYIGDDEAWCRAEVAIQNAVAKRGLEATIAKGEAAFYGPKLDFVVRDALGRKWQLGTVQVDYQLPERFDLTYTTHDNKKARPVIIHRAPLGSLERFIAILIEHTAGKLPLWLAPTQVVVLPVGGGHIAYAHKVHSQLQEAGIRSRLDDREETVGKKIREAEKEKIPYMLLVGDREVASGGVSIRKQGVGEEGNSTLEAFIEGLKAHPDWL